MSDNDPHQIEFVNTKQQSIARAADNIWMFIDFFSWARYHRYTRTRYQRRNDQRDRKA